LRPKARAEQIRRSLASWNRLVSLIAAKDVDGAQQQWVKHLETVGANTDDKVALAAHVATSGSRAGNDLSSPNRSRAIS
jgi:DNA-binding FadR family transcriptional regulator